MQTQKTRIFKVQNVILLALIAGALQLSACGHKGGSQAKPGQTIARVNGDEITIGQLNYELQRANINAAQQDAASKQIVQGLIDRQLVTQAALDAKLDRNPRVLLAIENAKAMVLAQAYLESKSQNVTKPTDVEINDYYNKHPDLYANRKIYLMDELSLAPDSYSKELNDVANAAKTLDEITVWLDKNHVAYNHAQATHASETLPEALRVQMMKMVVGDIVFIRAREGLIIGRIQAIKEASVPEAIAKPYIEGGLSREKRKAVAKEEMDHLRNAAKIVFLDEKYKPNASAMPSTSKTDADAAKPVDVSKPDANIEKGLSGL